MTEVTNYGEEVLPSTVTPLRFNKIKNQIFWSRVVNLGGLLIASIFEFPKKSASFALKECSVSCMRSQPWMESHLKRHLKNRPELTKQLSVQNFQQEVWELHLSTFRFWVTYEYKTLEV